MKHLSIIGIVAAIILTWVSAQGQQSRQELEKKKKQKLQEIAATQKYLNQIRQQQAQSVLAIQAVNRQIKIREYLIDNLNGQVQSMEQELILLQDSLKFLESELSKMRGVYAKMVYEGYKNRDRHQALQFILGAESFNQAFRRAIYLQQISLGRNRQLALLEDAKRKVYARQEEITGVKTLKESALVEEESEKNELDKDKEFKKEYLGKLLVDEKVQKKKLHEQQQSFKKLNQAIQEVIQREMEEVRKKKLQEKEKSADPAGPQRDAARKVKSVDEEKLSNDFSGNRNKLPWPVDEGFIQSSFGTHLHPTLKNIYVQNNGIDISTTKESKVKAVYRGTVKAVIQIPGMQTSVLVSHGEYFTVYCNLSEVYVKNGDQVSVKQMIGKAFKEEDAERSVVHFEIWKNTQKLNPEDWLGN